MELLFLFGRVPPPEEPGRRNRAFATRFFAQAQGQSHKKSSNKGSIPRAVTVVPVVANHLNT